jgi:hypothetical protein
LGSFSAQLPSRSEYTLSTRTLRVQSPAAPVFLSLLLAGSGYYAAWSITGLEGMLYGLLLLAAWWRYQEEDREASRLPISAVLFAALAMTRPEGLFMALVAAAYHVSRSMLRGGVLAIRNALLFPAVLGLLIGSYEFFRVSYYGFHLFPNSVRSKTGGGLYQIQRGVEYVIFNFVNPYLPLLLPLQLLARARQDPALLSGMGLFTGHVVVVVAAGGDWSLGRLFAPLLPLGAVVFVGTCGRLAAVHITARRRWTELPVALIAAGYLYYAYDVTAVQRERSFFEGFAAYDAERIAIGRWLRARAPHGTRIGVYAAGQIPYYSHLYAHDMLGLNDAHIASLEPKGMGKGIPGHEKSDAEYTLHVIRPHIIIDGHLVPGMNERPEFHARYRRVPLWRINAVHVTDDVYDILMEDSGE